MPKKLLSAIARYSALSGYEITPGGIITPVTSFPKIGIFAVQSPFSFAVGVGREWFAFSV